MSMAIPGRSVRVETARAIAPGAAAAHSPELSVVVPTLNERENLAPFLELIAKALDGVAWEVIFVDDDSRDGTAAEARRIAQHDPRVRCLQRIGRRGLSTACIEGALASAAPYVAVMDADLQHDERLLPTSSSAAVMWRAAASAIGTRAAPRSAALRRASRASSARPRSPIP
jgi:dolichol-phosphate mannosyltransferase